MSSPSLPPLETAPSGPLSALSSSALVAPLEPEERGRLDLRGPDTLGFLHRMTTSDVEGLAPGQSQLTSFPDRRGRLRAAGVVVRTGDASASVLLRGSAPALREWLDQFLFAEELEMSEAATAGVELLGPAARRLAAALVPVAPTSGEDLPPFAAFVGEGGAAFRWFDGAASGAPVTRMVVLTSDEDGGVLVDRALEAGAVLGPRPLVEAIRIAGGAPEAPAEIGEAHNPLELALHDGLHWGKGCYIGQEVIARIDNYGKQARHLVGLRAKGGSALPAGARLLEGEKAIGGVTSAATVDVGEGPTALALVRGEPRPGETVLVEVDEGEPVEAEILARAAAQAPHD